MNKKNKFSIIILALIIIALSFEVIRDTFTQQGDFSGYVLAGNSVMQGANIYAHPEINTWPPFFSIISVPIAVFDNFNKYLVRFIWLTLSVFAMYFIINYITRMALNRKLRFLPPKSRETLSDSEISLTHWLVLVPTIITLRYILDNLSNIQINIFMLWLSVSAIYYFSKGKNILAALILAFAISIKVYPIFLFFYFILKRESKIVLFTLLFIILFGCLPFLFFGIEQTLEYYQFWYNRNMTVFASVGHKNQSFFSMMRSLLTHESPGLNQPLNRAIYLNVLNLTIEQVKIVSYAITAIVGALVAYLFRDKLRQKNSLKAFLEYAFILSIIPIISPLAWKAYFIFLFPGYFINYLFLYKYEHSLNPFVKKYLIVTYYISIVLTVFSSELFMGNLLSDYLEAFSCITIGSLLLAGNILIMFYNYEKFRTVLKPD